MTESTARAERVKPQSSTPSSYIWEVAQKPVSVALPYGIIDRLEKEVVESFRSLTSRGSEVGGLLVGTVSPGSPALVCVDDFELVVSDYSRGPLYRLSDADMGRFEKAVEDRQKGDLRVVGYFRSHTRKGLSLDAEDLAFLDARFRDSHQIALLVRPYATKASTAGIFIREGGTLRGESSYMEFPFRSSQLTSFRPATPAVEPIAAPAAPAIAPANVSAPPIPAAPKPAVRAQIVPIASRREVNLPAPPPAAEPLVSQTPIEAPQAPKVVVPAPEPPKPEPKAEAAPAVDKVKEAIEPKEVAADPEAKPAKSKAGLVAGVLAAIGITVTALFVYPGFLRHGSIPIGGQAVPSLSLRVERTGTDILLTWNRDSESIKTAQHAVLSIFDGDRHENYDMDLGQLRNGSIVYSPITADVSFRMDVMRPGKAAPVSESVRVLRTRPSPMGEGGQPATQTASAKPGAAPAVKTPQTEAPAETATETPAPEESKPAAPVTPLKQFDASSLAQRLRPATPTDTLDAPSINPSVPQSAAGSISNLNIGGMAPAPTAPAPAAPSTTARKGAPSPGGQIRPAELITRREPEYPKLARQMGVKGVVELTATIGVDGKVKSVKVEKGTPLLSKAASDAVMQWVYKPCLLNGQAVQSDTRISLNFLGER
jgi:TonB family protein